MKSQCLLITILMFFVCSVFSSFADTTKPKQILTKADLPDGYFLNNLHTDKSTYYVESWSTNSNSTRKYYEKKYGNPYNAPPASFIDLVIYYYKDPITQNIINYHKGSVVDPNWKEVTPKGKKYGDRFYYLSDCSKGDGGLIKSIIVKKNKLCILTILHQKNSKYKSCEDPEKLIETIYSRL